MTTCYSHYSWSGQVLDSPVCCGVFFFPWFPPHFKGGFQNRVAKVRVTVQQWQGSCWVGMAQRQNPGIQLLKRKQGSFKGTHLRLARLWRCGNAHLSLEMQIQNMDWQSRDSLCLSVLCFPDRRICAGGGYGFLAGHQLLEMGNAV